MHTMEFRLDFCGLSPHTPGKLQARRDGRPGGGMGRLSHRTLGLAERNSAGHGAGGGLKAVKPRG